MRLLLPDVVVVTALSHTSPPVSLLNGTVSYMPQFYSFRPLLFWCLVINEGEDVQSPTPYWPIPGLRFPKTPSALRRLWVGGSAVVDRAELKVVL